MPKGQRRHRVHITLKNSFELGKAGSALTVEVKDGRRRLGVIEIGHGSIIWWGRKKRLGKRLPWRNLAELLEEAPGSLVRLTAQ